MENIETIDWRVEKRPLRYPHTSSISGDTVWVESAKQSLVRTDTGQELAVVGSGYQPLQNSKLIEVGERLTDSGLITSVEAACFGGGRTVLVRGAVDGTKAEILPGDSISAYIALFNRHTGQDSWGVLNTESRHLCENIIGGHDKDIQRYAHTGDVGRMFQDVTNQLHYTLSQFEKVVQAYRFLAHKPMSYKEFERYACILIDPEFLETPEPDRIIPSAAGDIIDCYLHADTCEGATWWHGYNAVTYYLTHQRGREDTREASVLLGAGRLLRNKALDMALKA